MSSWAGAVVAWDGVAGTPWQGHASRVLAQAGIPETPPRRPAAGAGLVLVDERCPGTTADDVRRVVAAAAASGTVAAGVRPVTDTVKRLQEGYVGPSVDREGLVAVCSPLVVPAGLVERLDSVDDLPGLVARLAGAGVRVVHVEVPVAARRLADASELVLLEDAARR